MMLINSEQKKRHASLPPKSCCFVTMYIFNTMSCIDTGYLGKPESQLGHLDISLDYLKGGRQDEFGKCLVLTHAHTAWNSLFTIGQGTTDAGIDANWTEE